MTAEKGVLRMSEEAWPTLRAAYGGEKVAAFVYTAASGVLCRAVFSNAEHPGVVGVAFEMEGKVNYEPSSSSSSSSSMWPLSHCKKICARHSSVTGYVSGNVVTDGSELRPKARDSGVMHCRHRQPECCV